jgi:PAS domain S-box-containing protein
MLYTESKEGVLMKASEKAAQSPNEAETLSPAAFRLMIHELRVHQIELAMQNEELRRANATLQAVMDQSPAGIAIADAPSGKLRYVNDAGLLIRGGTRETVINGIGIDQYVASWRLMDLDGRPLNPDEVPLARAVLFGETCSREFIIRKDDGDDRIVLGNAAPIKDEGGRVVAGVVVFADMTERKRTEAALEDSEREFRLLAESMPQIVWITRADGWNIYFNQQWVDYTGMTLDESYGHGWNIPFHPDDRQRAWDAWQNATNNDATYALECRLRRSDGAYRWWLIRGVPLRDPDGEILKWFGTCTDIEHIKQGEIQIASHLKELQRWQNVMLDREDRVRELKREVNGFCRRVGEAPRYPSQEDAAAEPGEAQAKQEHNR